MQEGVSLLTHSHGESLTPCSACSPAHQTAHCMRSVGVAMCGCGVGGGCG